MICERRCRLAFIQAEMQDRGSGWVYQARNRASVACTPSPELPGTTPRGGPELLALLGFQEKSEIGIFMGVTCWSLIQIKITAGVCGHEFVTSDLT